MNFFFNGFMAVGGAVTAVLVLGFVWEFSAYVIAAILPWVLPKKMQAARDGQATEVPFGEQIVHEEHREERAQDDINEVVRRVHRCEEHAGEEHPEPWYTKQARRTKWDSRRSRTTA